MTFFSSSLPKIIFIYKYAQNIKPTHHTIFLFVNALIILVKKIYISELVCARNKPSTGLSWHKTKIGANVGGTPTNRGWKIIEVAPPGQNLGLAWPVVWPGLACGLAICACTCPCAWPGLFLPGHMCFCLCLCSVISKVIFQNKQENVFSN